jgi:ribose-phosphate pyrophosphokinase
MADKRRPRLVAGRGNLQLAEETARLLDVPLTSVTAMQFPDTETYVRLLDSVRGDDVFVIQPTSPPVNDNLVELLLLIDALRRASAQRVTAVIPYYGYARQERKAKGREAISAKVVADVLTSVGADRVITIDIHSPAMQGFFNIPMDSLSAIPLIAAHLRRCGLDDTVIVAPDVGRARWADKYGELLNRPIALMHKRRGHNGDVEVAHVVGDVRGLRPIVVDDILAGGSVVGQLDALVRAGARPEITLAIVHGVLVGQALRRLAAPIIREVIVTDTIAVPEAKRLDGKVTVLSVAPLLAEAIRRTHEDESVSPMFQVM